MPRKPKIVALEPSARAAPTLPPDEVAQAVAAVLRPMIGLLLRSGLDYPRLSGELKTLFIEEAVVELGRAGQATTDSAISLLSGVHRKDVRNRRVTGRPPGAARPVALSARVFARWISDAACAGADGRPRALPRTGPAPSFEALVRAVTQDVHPFTVLQELIRLGIAEVEIQDGGELVVPAHPDFVPPAGSREALDLLAANLADHANAAVSNVLGGQPTLEQSVFASGITAASAERLQAVARSLWARMRGDLIEAASRLYEADQDRPDARSRVRFGSYFWSGPWEPAAPDRDTPGDETP
ncbi:hypothetical protein HHL11_12095 [Ramlibacter sp. G-1-2-2]|uniref:Uncharacterized protein n=1 Tax=Ramlibacter agri TaxID=2728837 RepID=A0A848H200_9BURK|nr:DUF6502 family protein [Ramlibacter agri]NML44497.1 hypothetical protein [Ramlibacter agri]